jgi:hypothetical protein
MTITVLPRLPPRFASMPPVAAPAHFFDRVIDPKVMVIRGIPQHVSIPSFIKIMTVSGSLRIDPSSSN